MEGQEENGLGPSSCGKGRIPPHPEERLKGRTESEREEIDKDERE